VRLDGERREPSKQRRMINTDGEALRFAIFFARTQKKRRLAPA
jgi:hypothetical protein